MIQYFPNGVSIPQTCFTSIPTSWQLNSFPMVRSKPNVTKNDTFTTNQTLLPTNIMLTYGQFSPAVVFNITLSNNPSVQTSTSLTAFALAATDSAPTPPATRKLINVSTFDTQFQTPLIATTSTSFGIIFNNWTIPNILTSYTAANYLIYMPYGNYANPPATIYNSTSLSSAADYYQSINNYFVATVPYGQWLNYNIDLANTNASTYTFQIYQGGGYGAIGYTMVIQLLTSATTLTQVQSYKIQTVPFQLPLENGMQYRFLFYSPQQQLLYTSALAIWPNPITIYLPSSVNVTPFYNPHPIVNCTWNPTPVNFITLDCAGRDTQNFVKSWSVYTYNVSSILAFKTLVNVTNATGASFNSINVFPYINAYYDTQVVAHVGNLTDPSIIAYETHSPSTTQPIIPAAAGGGILAIFMFLAMVFSGAETKSVMLAMSALAVFVLSAINAFPISVIAAWGYFVFVGALIFMFETDRL